MRTFVEYCLFKYFKGNSSTFKLKKYSLFSKILRKLFKRNQTYNDYSPVHVHQSHKLFYYTSV